MAFQKMIQNKKKKNSKIRFLFPPYRIDYRDLERSSIFAYDITWAICFDPGIAVNISRGSYPSLSFLLFLSLLLSPHENSLLLAKFIRIKGHPWIRINNFWHAIVQRRMILFDP